MKTLLKLPKLAIAIILLLFFYLIETFLMIIYLVVETPLSWLLDKSENIIKYLVKNA